MLDCVTVTLAFSTVAFGLPGIAAATTDSVVSPESPPPFVLFGETVFKGALFFVISVFPDVTPSGSEDLFFV